MPSERIAKYGNVEIILPEVDGMIECRTNPSMKDFFDEINYPGNIMLGGYVNSDRFSKILNNNSNSFDDYFLVYASSISKEINSTKADMAKLGEMITNGMGKGEWEVIKGKIENKIEFATVGKPVLIDEYSVVADIMSFVMLGKYIVNKKEIIRIVVSNIALIKDRLIWMAYYKDYNGEESLTKAKAKNDYLAILISNENKRNKNQSDNQNKEDSNYTNKEGRFSIWFTHEPEIDNVEQIAAGKKSMRYGFICHDDSESYYVSYTNLPLALDVKSKSETFINQYFQNQAQLTADEMNGKVVSQKVINFDRGVCREIKIKSIINGQTVMFMLRSYLINDKQYSVMYYTTPELFNFSNMYKFFNSFELL